MSVKLRTRTTKKGVVYYLDIYQQGERVRETLTIPFNLSEKERRRIAELNRADREVLLSNTNHIPAKPRNFIAYFEKYMTEYRANRKYKNTLRHLKLLFGKTLLTTAINDRTMGKWRDYLVKNFNGETPATMWRTTRAVINRGVREGVFVKDPAPNVKGPRRANSEIRNVLFEDEIIDLAKRPFPNDEVCRAFLFCCYTGMGRAELVNLKWSDFDRELKSVRFMRAKTLHAPIYVQMRLSPTARKLLPYKRSDGLVWPAFPSEPTCRKVLKKWTAHLDKKITWYSARHSFCLLLLSNGVDLVTASKLMGHKTLDMTLKYLNFLEAQKSDAIDRLPELDI